MTKSFKVFLLKKPTNLQISFQIILTNLSKNFNQNYKILNVSKPLNSSKTSRIFQKTLKFIKKTICIFLKN